MYWRTSAHEGKENQNCPEALLWAATIQATRYGCRCLRTATKLWKASLLVLGLLPIAVVWEAGDDAMAKGGLPSLGAVTALSATTFEGMTVPAANLFTPNGAVIFMIRRMG